MRDDVTFESKDVRCRAWHYRPAGSSPAPCVVIGHGFDGVREQGLDAYAERFAAIGIASLVFDYRFFGSSDGEPRQVVDTKAQLDDWRAAISCARALDSIDPDRIALWGTSTSGGHVVKLAAEDDRIAAVVAQVPLLDGRAQLLTTPLLQSIGLLWAGVKDGIRTLLRLPPLMIASAGRPGALAAVTSPDALSGLEQITPTDSTWRNEVAARFALTTPLYRPITSAARLRCPLLVCIADGDRVIPEGPALKAASTAALGELRRYPVGHFGMYFGDGFERAVAHQAAFLRRWLIGAEVASRGAERPPTLKAVP